MSREKNDYLYSIRGIIRPSIEGIAILQSREYFWIPLFLCMSCGRSVESLDCLPCCSEEANSVRWVVSKTRDRKKNRKLEKNVFLKNNLRLPSPFVRFPLTLASDAGALLTSSKHSQNTRRKKVSRP